MNHGTAVLGSPWGDKGFPGSSVGKESACNAGDPSSTPGLGRPAGEGIGYPLQYSWAFLVAQLVKNPPAMWETWVDPWVGKVSWRRERIPTPVFWPGEFHGQVQGVAKSQTQLSNFTGGASIIWKNDYHLELHSGTCCFNSGNVWANLNMLDKG